MALSLDEALGMSLADEADESIHVDIDTRQITIPESQKLFGVESDADVEVKHIVIDGRYADGNRDLSKLAWRVVYRNAKKESGYYLIPSVVANKNSIDMDWLIKRSVVAYKGTVDFILCAFATTSSGEVTPEWNSTLGQGIVLKGLETSAIDIGKESVDELSKILYETITAKDAAAKSASDAQGYMQTASAAATDANASAENAAVSKAAAENSASAAAGSEQAAAESKAAAQEAATEAERSAGIASDAADGSALNTENAQKSANNAAESQSEAKANADAAAKSQQSAAIDAKTASDAKVAAAGSADAAAGSANAAENSASAAAGSEQAAGASELKAAESEKAAKASEQAAAESAQAALESKTAAATSEVNAAASAKKAQDVADSLPEDYTTAVNEIAALKQQVANITPDDSAIGGKPWSSKHIIDMLCPPLEESGNPVVCYPVAGYALGVKASWEPVQEGSGTPSPENIRPIKGRDSVRVERCGENLIDSDRVTEVSAPYGLTAQYVSGKITISGIYSNSSAHASFSFMSLSYKLPPTTKFMHLGSKSVGCKVDGIRFTNKNRDKIAIDLSGLTTGEKAEISFYLIAYVDTTAPTTYTPYIGQTNTLPLPETVYGGEVDAVSGEGQETQKFVILNGTESWNSWGINAHNPAITGFYTYGINDYDAKNAKGICSHLETPNQDVWGGRNAGIGFATVGSSRYFMFSILTSSIPDISAGHEVASLKAYLAAQNDAGTPVQIAYKLAEPVPITATGAQPIPALAGANTVLTDADSVTVTGRADPIKRITDLEAAVASIN